MQVDLKNVVVRAKDFIGSGTRPLYLYKEAQGSSAELKRFRYDLQHSGKRAFIVNKGGKSVVVIRNKEIKHPYKLAFNILKARLTGKFKALGGLKEAVDKGINIYDKDLNKLFKSFDSPDAIVRIFGGKIEFKNVLKAAKGMAKRLV